MPTTPIISTSHVSYAFASAWALRDVTLRIDAGDFVFLTGPSGAGKTTFLRILHGALPLQRGHATIAGYDLHSMHPRRLHRLRQEVTVVFQDFKVLDRRSVRENIALPLLVRGMPKEQIKRRTNAVLRGLHLEKKADSPCGGLSGGEQQRVAIARSIVVSPKVLLADEPTGNVDPDYSLRLLDIFHRFNVHGTTVVLATHDQNLIQAMPGANILHLEQGRVRGNPNAQSPAGD